jgi:hypothetical protein
MPRAVHHASPRVHPHPLRPQELIEFDEEGRPVAKGLRSSGGDGGRALWAEDEDDGFGVSGWDQFGGNADDGSDDDDGAAAPPVGPRKGLRPSASH